MDKDAELEASQGRIHENIQQQGRYPLGYSSVSVREVFLGEAGTGGERFDSKKRRASVKGGDFSMSDVSGR